MTSIPLKRDAVISMFGTRAGNKLLQFLINCCQTEPAITLTFNATCAGLDTNGNPTYNVVASATYNVNITGYTTLFGYFSNQPFPNWTNITPATINNLNINEGNLFVNNIVASIPCVLANIVVNNLNPGTYYGMVTDNRGNYATPVTITLPACPKPVKI